MNSVVELREYFHHLPHKRRTKGTERGVYEALSLYSLLRKDRRRKEAESKVSSYPKYLFLAAALKWRY